MPPTEFFPLTDNVSQLSQYISSLRMELANYKEASKDHLTRLESDLSKALTSQGNDRRELEKMINEAVSRCRTDLETKLKSLDDRTTDNRDAINLMSTDFAVLKSERTDNKALWVFVRNTALGALLGVIITFVLNMKLMH